MKTNLRIHIILTVIFSSFTIFHLGGTIPHSSETEYSIVNTKHGPIEGVTVLESNGKKVTKFLGIPYAKPPLGALRFKQPSPPDSWNHILNTTVFSKSCLQRSINAVRHVNLLRIISYVGDQSEDCLYLNVFVPEPKPDYALPVVIFIHGGSFSMGSGSVELYDGSIFASEEKIIFVNLNYRLGALGFMYLNNSEVEPNPGLYDQKLAIKWVHDNIEQFGGDPNMVTLMGQSAGAACVGHHMLSDLSKDYIKRGIYLSGAPQANWALQTMEENVEFANTLVEYMDCENKTNDAALGKCLLETEGMDVILNSPFYDVDSSVFKPIVDGVIIKENTGEMMKKKMFKKTEILAGVTKDEAGLFLSLIRPDAFPLIDKTPKLFYSDFEYIAKWLLRYLPKALIQTAIHQYTNFNRKNDQEEILRSSHHLMADSQFVCDVYSLAEMYASEGQDVFHYYFTQETSLKFFPKWMGVFHGQDLVYVTGMPFRSGLNFTQQEKIFSKRVMRYFGNFIRTGNPNTNPKGKRSKVFWPKFTIAKELSLVLKSNTSAVVRQLRKQKCAFWNELVPYLRFHLQKNETQTQIAT